MKLRNKKTGDIYELNEFCLYDDKGFAKRPFLKSLSELNEEWEDAPEEPKVYWYMSNRGDIRCITDEDTYWDNDRKEIGNYFATKEEAEKAVEKLKAWQRLKDNGFRFKGRYKPNYGEDFIVGCRLPKETLVVDVAEDLDLLFGGEE